MIDKVSELIDRCEFDSVEVMDTETSTRSVSAAEFKSALKELWQRCKPSDSEQVEEIARLLKLLKESVKNDLTVVSFWNNALILIQNKYLAKPIDWETEINTLGGIRWMVVSELIALKATGRDDSVNKHITQALQSRAYDNVLYSSLPWGVVSCVGIATCATGLVGMGLEAEWTLLNVGSDVVLGEALAIAGVWMAVIGTTILYCSILSHVAVAVRPQVEAQPSDSNPNAAVFKLIWVMQDNLEKYRAEIAYSAKAFGIKDVWSDAAIEKSLKETKAKYYTEARNTHTDKTQSTNATDFQVLKQHYDTLEAYLNNKSNIDRVMQVSRNWEKSLNIGTVGIISAIAILGALASVAVTLGGIHYGIGSVLPVIGLEALAIEGTIALGLGGLNGGLFYKPIPGVTRSQDPNLVLGRVSQCIATASFTALATAGGPVIS